MNDLEFLRELFKDSRLHIGIGVVTQLGLSQDNSKLRVMVNLLPENREVVAEMTFADVYDVTFPETQDLAIVLFVDGHPDEAFVVKLVTTAEELIPIFARDGDSVKYSRPGKKLYIGSDTKVGIARPNVEPSEPLVLGNQLVAFMQGIIDQVKAVFDAISTGPVSDFGNLGAPVPTSASIQTAISGAKTQLNDLANQYLTVASTNIVSQLAFTERGE